MASREDMSLTEQWLDPNSSPPAPALMVTISVSPLYQWLNFVTRMIAPRDIPLLKLCLYPAFKSRREQEKANTIPELFHAIVNSDNPEYQQEVLYQFICALKVIGGKQRGRECIIELEKRGINVPKATDHTESKEFRFFQCLARVVREIESHHEDREKIKEACGRRLKKNPRHYEYIADMFRDIHEVQFVTSDDCTNLYELFGRCENGEQYTKIMSKYNEMERRFNHLNILCLDFIVN